MDKIAEVLTGEKDHAIFPLVCADHCAWLAQVDFVDVATDPEKLAEVTEYAYKHYEYDMVLIFSDAYVEAQAMGCPVRLSPFPTLSGPRAGKHSDRTDVIVGAAQIMKSKIDVPVFASIKGPFSLASFLAGIKEFLKMTIKEPEQANEIIEEALAFQMSYLARILNLGVHVFIGDPVASSSVVSPGIFTQFALEPLKRIIKAVKDADLMAGVHICGDSLPIIEKLDTLGADILSIENIKPETRTLKMGGVSTSTIRYGHPPDIVREVDAALREPHLILSTSCDVPVETPTQNLQSMIRHARSQSNR